MDPVPNLLAERYASDIMREIWSPRGKVLLEREFWIALMKAQRELGCDIPKAAISAYEECKDRIDLQEIRRREEITRHDVKARIEVFCQQAGYEHIHRGLTSRDVTENVEQLQLYRSLRLIELKGVAALVALSRRADQFKHLVITGRTHEMPAQPTTLGRRFAMFGEEFILALNRLHNLIERFPFRGIKGAVGTQLDALTLFDNDARKVDALERSVMRHLSGKKVLQVTGQIYPRSLDFEVVSALFQLSCSPSNFARSIRLMAGHELVSEGFSEKQVGSSAMPHKMNSRSCERINGFGRILQGHVAMAAAVAGDQWNEGDVSCSVVRRVLLPDCFFAIDGLIDTLLWVLRNLRPFPAAIEREKRKYMPFLATTTVLTEATKRGLGRETAHDIVREHALAAWNTLQSDETTENDLLDRLAGDSRLGMNRAHLQKMLDAEANLVGTAGAQVEAFLDQVRDWEERLPEALDYRAGGIL